MSQSEVPAGTAGLVGFVDGLRYDDLPVAVVDQCVRAVVNAVGCTLGGSRHPIADTLVKSIDEFSGSRTTTLLGRSKKSDLLTAALINGTSGAAYSFDDTYSEAMLHPCGPILVALLGVSERIKTSGRDFLAAFAGGLEVACRLTKAIALAPAEGDMAWSQTGIVCGPAAALAAGKLIGLSREALHWAVGIAVSESAGTRATHGSMAASLIFGHAAQTGLRAALLAQGGLTNTPNGIERGSGFAQMFSRKAHLPALAEGLGTAFELLSITYKPYPSGVVIHPATEAILRLRAEHGFAGSDVSQIILDVSRGAVEFANRPEPKDDIEAKVSIQHWAAVSALRGRAGLAEGTLAMVKDPEVARLRAATVVAARPELGQGACEAAIVLSSGRRLTIRIDSVVGSVERPMSDAELDRKCTEQAELALGAERASGVAAACREIAALDDVSAIAARAA